jgi:hypothetical protein
MTMDKPVKKKDSAALEAALQGYDDLKMTGGKKRITRTDLEKLGHSAIVAAQAVTQREVEAKRQDLTAHEALPPSWQKRFNIAIKAYKKQLDLEFLDKVREETQRHLDENILPLYTKRRAEADFIVKHNKGVFTADEYKQIVRCLHPDSQPSIEQKNAAFQTFNEHKPVLLAETEKDNGIPPIPRSAAEMMARKRTKK